MKLPSLAQIVAVAVLGLSGNLMAQTPEATKIPPFPEATQNPSNPMRPPGAWANAPSEEDLQELSTLINLGQGTLGRAAENLEHRYFEKFAKTGLVDYQMPKLIFGPGAHGAKIEGELMLSLYNMRAVDAVALIAAAAGCRLEPIPAPPDSPDDKKKPQRVVGYHVTLATNSNPMLMPEIKPVVQELPPRSLTNITTLRPPLVRVVEPVVDTLVYSNVAVPGPGMPGTFNDVPLPLAPAADPAMAASGVPGMPPAAIAPSSPGQSVRIYPVAFFFRGDETTDQLLEKNVGLKTLIEELVKDAEPSPQSGLVLNMHHATKILIVKATPAQHEIIQQIMTSLKENAKEEAQRTATLPR